MKFLAPLFALVLLGSINAPAQVVTVEVKLDQEQFLPGETLPITIRVVNNSGQTLHLGNAGWLTFSVLAADANSAVLKNAEPPVVEPFVLGSGEVATKRLDISPYYNLKRAGRYRITATVHINEWNTDASSKTKDFDVIDGAEIWSRDFGVPLAAGATNQLPEVRKYILEEANYLRHQLRMYVLVSDQTRTRFFKVQAVGPMVSFSQPEAQLDRVSNLHVLYQSGAKNFIYTKVNPDGTIVQQDVYELVTSRPRLALNDQGEIVVTGGVRRPRPGEMPDIVTPDQVPAPAPAK